MSSSDAAILVSSLSKRFEIYKYPVDRLKQFIFPKIWSLASKSPRKYFDEFWALSDISFEVKKGETIAIIGQNGSGKSTLLQIICGTLSPTVGSVRTNGKVAALLELGSGFNPEFTGRENVYLNASVLGLTKNEIDNRFNSIIKFADIGDFIDQPVKNYSSGMSLRLAFAVIAHVDADILIVDEALSVGDVFFSQKCMRFFEEHKARGGTMLLVSHDTTTVAKLCERAVLLASGRIKSMGSVGEVCKIYLKDIYDSRDISSLDVLEHEMPRNPSVLCNADIKKFEVLEQAGNRIVVTNFNNSSDSLGIGGVQILDAGFFDKYDKRLSSINTGDRVKFTVYLKANIKVSYPAVGIVVKNTQGQPIFAESTTWAFDGQYGVGRLELMPGERVQVNFDFEMPILLDGEYPITVAVAEGFGHDHVQHHLVHEALLLHVSGRRLLHGISGFSRLKTEILIGIEEQ
jgi:lipopolysaccharide transport system ATP-binding protein